MNKPIISEPPMNGEFIMNTVRVNLEVGKELTP